MNADRCSLGMIAGHLSFVAMLALAPGCAAKAPSAVNGTSGPSGVEAAWAAFEDGKQAMKKHRYCEAQAGFLRCLEVQPNNAECQLGLASTLARLRRVDDGAEHYREFLRLAPDHKQAREVQALLKDYESAKQQFGATSFPGRQGAGCRPPAGGSAGPPPSEEVARVVESNQGAFRSCVEPERKKNSGFKGATVKLMVTVDVSGFVKKVVVDQGEGNQPGLGECLEGKARQMVFYAFDGNDADVEIPLTLSSLPEGKRQ